MLDEVMVPEDVVVTSPRPRKPRSTIELSLFLTTLGLSLTGVAVSNLILYRTCVHVLGQDREQCSWFQSPDGSGGSTQLEQDVQQHAIFINTVRSVLESLTPAALSLFLGAWSDRYGRKPLIVYPLLGVAVSSMLIVVYSMIDVGPWWFLVTSLPFSLAGGVAVLSAGSYCYINDVTSTENRTARMFLVQIAASGGMVSGSLLSAPLLHSLGLVYLLLTGAAISVVAYAVTDIYLVESLVGAAQGNINSIMDFQLVKDMFRECFKKRPNSGRAQGLLIVAILSLTAFVLFGTMSLEYLYTREKLHWTLKDFTVYSAANTLVGFVGGFLGVSVLQGLCKISDLPLVVLAFGSALAEYFTKLLAVDTWHMYLGAGLSMFKGLSGSVLRSFVSKVVEEAAVSRWLTLVSVSEAVCPLLSPALYNALYAATIASTPGAFYMLSVALTALTLLLIGIVLYLRRHATSPYERIHADDILR